MGPKRRLGDSNIGLEAVTVRPALIERRPQPMNNNNMEALIKKLRSLQAKTIEAGCTEAEAFQAAEKVAELLDKYGLSVERLKLETAKDEVTKEGFDLGSKREPHSVVMCMAAIAKYTSTRSWYRTGRLIEYTFFGFPTDVKIAGWLLRLFKESMDTDYRTYHGTYTGSLHWKTVRKIFMEGMGDRLNGRLHELTEKRSRPPEMEIEEADAPPSYELMVLKERNVERAFAGLKMKISNVYRTCSGSDAASKIYRAGAEAGDRVRFHAGELK